ncbi:hypothetical protein VTP01DRAFT_2971 [Rhizomucor pusillus]|uniref:uncharacterized protein n=1 Tax=Rhizomucor pusillus TaxID=4840 RepID=UPI003743FE16
MQPLFDAGGWSLPTEIIPQEHAKKNKKKQKQKPVSTSNEADQLQQQLTKVNGKQQQQKKQQKQQSPGKRKHAADAEQQPPPPPAKKQKAKQQKKDNQQWKKAEQQALEQKEPKDVTMHDVQDKADNEPVKNEKVDKSKKQQQQQQKKNEAKKSNNQTAKPKDEQVSQTVKDAETDSKQQKKAGSDNLDKKNVKKNTVNEQQRKKLQELLSKKNSSNNNNSSSSSSDNNNNSSAASTAAAAKQQQPAKTAAKNAEKPSKLTALQQKMKDKLSGARFRWLNEQLYTTRGNEAYKIFNEKPELFDEYHEGFRHQVESWPVNPVDVIINQLNELPKGTVVADLGCGDAKIAHAVTHLSILSFDLVAKNDKVIACDIAKLPIPANFVDVAVFSLSLMGTNYLDFLDEAKRVLKSGGELKIAEVVSRFSDVNEFIHLVELLGFNFEGKDDSNKMFIMLYFRKQDTAVDEEIDEEMLEGLDEKAKQKLKEGAGVSVPKAKLKKKAKKLLKPCVYKKR